MRIVASRPVEPRACFTLHKKVDKIKRSVYNLTVSEYRAVRDHPARARSAAPKQNYGGRAYCPRFVWLHIKRYFFMVRYSEITEKKAREIVLLRGSGCAYRGCTFCDYHLDSCADEDENYALNAEVLSHVTGKYGEIEIINSGSVFELDGRTIELIKSTCREKGITVIHFEAHYMYRNEIAGLRRSFDGFTLKMKLGLETFDYDLRERVLRKGIAERDERRIAQGFDEANFLFGVSGQTESSMLYDMRTGLKYFERICVNLMCENTTSVKPDGAVADVFLRKVYPLYKDDPRVDILIENTDFGVGA